MEGGAAASQEAVHQSQSLCAGEQDYVRERKQKVLATLQKLGIKCAEEKVPHIALLGTGGGQRACVALMGSLYQMKEEGLLDTLLYLAGVSGSTWCMSVLYSDPQWSTNMDKAASRLVGPGIPWEQKCEWLVERSKEENFSLTDFWGLIISAAIFNRLEPRYLSEEASRPVTNPYPVYCAIEKYHFSKGPIEGIFGSAMGDFITMIKYGISDLFGWNKVSEVEAAEDKMMFAYKRVNLRRQLADYLRLLFNICHLLLKIPCLLLKWEWGTTANFLYQYKSDGNIAPYLHSKKRVHLIDAGLMINTGYPSFLGDKRDIDLIIAPEYSAGDAFETLTLARTYAADMGKPFPKIDEKVLEDKHWPQDCYVFEGKGKEPTIVYMLLFNRKNCKDAAEVEAKMKEFCTFHWPYSGKQIKKLLEIAKANIRNNKMILRSEIEKAALRRQTKSTGAVKSAI